MLVNPIWVGAPILGHSDNDLVQMTLPSFGGHHIGIGYIWEPDGDWSWNRGTDPVYLGSADSWLSAMAMTPPIPQIKVQFHWRT